MVMGRSRRIGQPVPSAIPTIHLDEETQAAIVAALKPTLEDLAMAKPQRQIVFKNTVLPLQGITEHKTVPTIKTVKTVTIHWPDGTNSLVEVAMGYSQDKRLLPEEGYLALNDATPTWNVNKDIDSDTLWVEVRNGDLIKSHTISVIVNYEEA